MNIIQRAIHGLMKSANLEDRYTLFSNHQKGNFTNKGSADFLRYNDISLYVNKSIEIRAEKVSEIYFVLRDNKGKTIESHAILDLLNRPNEYHTGKQFWKLFQKYYDLTGNVFILIVKEGEIFDLKSKMYLLRPDLVKVVDDGKGTIKYEYKKGSETVTYTSDQILHCINPSPVNPVAGVSLLKAGVRAIETEIQLEEYQANVLANGGKVEGIFKFKNAITKTQADEMKEKYVEDLAGAKKSGRPLFLGGDADYQNISLSPIELSYLESKKATLNDICILTGVPQAMLSSLGDQTFSNSDASLRVFLRETIKPLLINLTDFLDWRLVPKDLELTFIDPTPEDVDNKIKVISALYATDSATINERRMIMGLEKYEDPFADQLLVSFSKSPIDDLSNDVFANSYKGLTKSHFDATKGVETHPLKDKAFREAYGKRQAQKLDKNEKIFASAVKDYFFQQETRLKSHLTGVKAFKDIAEVKGFVDEIFDLRLETKLAQGMAIPLLRKMMIRAGQESTNLLDYDFGFTMTSALQGWLDDKTFKFAEEITQTTYKKLTNEFTASFEAGENRDQLVKRIKGIYDGFDDNRAKTIARTEVHGATQKAVIEGNRQAGSKIKIWVAVLDDSTRDSHAMQDGEERPIDTPFSNGQQYAGDDSVDVAEFINCRCQS